MNTNAQEIQRAVQSLGFEAERFRQLSPEEAHHIYQSALRHFVSHGQPRWWWEHFSAGRSVQFVAGDGWRHLTEIAPDADERIWFIADDFAPPEYSVWEASVRDVQAVIAECYGFEFYIVQQQYHWLVCENHHNVVFAVGAEVEERLGEYDVA